MAAAEREVYQVTSPEVAACSQVRDSHGTPFHWLRDTSVAGHSSTLPAANVASPFAELPAVPEALLGHLAKGKG